MSGKRGASFGAWRDSSLRQAAERLAAWEEDWVTTRKLGGSDLAAFDAELVQLRQELADPTVPPTVLLLAQWRLKAWGVDEATPEQPSKVPRTQACVVCGLRDATERYASPSAPDVWLCAGAACEALLLS